MNCVFLGHRSVTSIAKLELKAEIIKLKSSGADCFYVGNNGNFDFLVQSVLCEIEEDGDNIKYEIVLSYIGEKPLCSKIKNTLFPSGQETALPRYAISKRNEWLLEQADVMIVYLNNKISNTYKYVRRAEKKGIRIINLAEK